MVRLYISVLIFTFSPLMSLKLPSVRAATCHCADSNVLLFLLRHFLTTNTPVPLIHLAVLLWRASFAAARRTQHFVAATSDLMHPHDVHDVQADTGADPGYTATPGHQVEGFGAIDRIHTAVVDRHDSDANHEKDHCHGNAVRHVGSRGLRITKHLKEPAEKQCTVNKLSLGWALTKKHATKNMSEDS